jgi:hypothetical protein
MVYFQKQDKCPKCLGLVTDKLYYNRFCWERVAFIATLSILAGLVAAMANSAPIAIAFGTAFFLVAIYYVANHVMGIGDFNERFFSEDAIPGYAVTAFSWRKYSREFFFFFKVLLAAMLAALMFAIMGKIFDWICG